MLIRIPVRFVLCPRSNIPFLSISVLAYHYAQLEASAFREEFNPDTFEDPTKPKIDMIHKVPFQGCFLQYTLTGLQRAGTLIKEWKDIIESDDSSKVTVIQKAGAPGGGTKRKAVCQATVVDATTR